jgi:hypothetical protein
MKMKSIRNLSNKKSMFDDVTQRYLSRLPPQILGSVSCILSPKWDGDCGFRVVAQFLGWGEEAWFKVREDLYISLRSGFDFREVLGGPEQLKIAVAMLLWGPNLPPPPKEQWMRTADHLYFIAERYQIRLTFFFHT